jgi:outer membrane protein OmpA-like peptidoglycan-associated protein
MASGNRSLTVYFDVPVANGTAITDYEYSTDNGVTFVSAGTAVSPVIITTVSTAGHAALGVGQSYDVVLRAVNDAGAGQSSNPIVGITNDVPGAPTGVIATAGNASISVSFTAPQDGGNAITRYEYSINGGTTAVNTGSMTPAFTIASLTNGTSYTVKVRAVNANGASAWATAAAVTPKAPTVLATWQTKAAARSYFTVVTSAGTHSVVVKTTTPKACVVKGYTVYFLMSGTCTVTVTQDGKVLRTLNSSVAKTNAVSSPAKAQRITSINMTTKGTTLDAGTKKALDKLVANLRKSAIVIVYGCAAKNSSTAVTAANRATAVASYLKSKGVSVASFAGYGSTIAASGKALKDRVDLGTA